MVFRVWLFIFSNKNLITQTSVTQNINEQQDQ